MTAAASLYFAYGSNMDEGQMRARVAGAHLVGPAWLKGHAFIFSGFSRTWGGATANVTASRKPGARVFGLLWQLPPGGLAALDRFEGYPTSYQRKTATVQLDAGPVARAVVYYRRALVAQAPPSPAYVAQIMAALKRYGQA